MSSGSLRFKGKLNEKQFVEHLGVWIEWTDPRTVLYYDTNEIGANALGELVNGKLVQLRPNFSQQAAIDSLGTTPLCLRWNSSFPGYVCGYQCSYEMLMKLQERAENKAMDDILWDYHLSDVERDALIFDGRLNEKEFVEHLGVWIEWIDPSTAHYYDTNAADSTSIGKIVNGHLIPFRPCSNFTVGDGDERTTPTCLIWIPECGYLCKHQLKYEKKVKEFAQAQDAEKKTAVESPKDVILTYDDGSCYIGEVLYGKKHGKGMLSTLAFVYTPHIHSNPEDAHLAKWNEYEGEWVNDKMHGYGKMVRKCRNGNSTIIYEGIWENGVIYNKSFMDIEKSCHD